MIFIQLRGLQSLGIKTQPCFTRALTGSSSRLISSYTKPANSVISFTAKRTFRTRRSPTSVNRTSFNTANSESLMEGAQTAVPASQRMWQLAGAGAVIGLGVIAIDGLREGGVASAGASTGTYPAVISKRITATYGYVLAGLGVTAATAAQIVRSGAHYRLMSVNPIALAIGSFALTMGAFFVTKSATDPVTQHAAWVAFNASVGLSLFPVALMGGALVQKAALGTAAIVGSISLIAATSRSDAHLAMAGPLAVGFGVVLAASFGSMFFPASSLMYNVSIYGGLAVFGGLTFFDTQRMIQKAKIQPQYNPLRESMGIYLQIINIFTRVIAILGGGNRKK
eukprot:CFRG0434T1